MLRESKRTKSEVSTDEVNSSASENKYTYEYYYTEYARLREAQDQHSPSTTIHDISVANIQYTLTTSINNLVAPHSGLRDSLEETYQTRHQPDTFGYQRKHNLEHQLETAEIQLRNHFNYHYDTDFAEHRMSKASVVHSKGNKDEIDIPLSPLSAEQRQLLDTIYELKSKLNNTPIESLKNQLEESEIQLWQNYGEFTRIDYNRYAQMKNELQDLAQKQALCKQLSDAGDYIRLSKKEIALYQQIDSEFPLSSAKGKLFDKIYQLKNEIILSQPQDYDFCQIRDELDLLKNQLAQNYPQYYKNRKELHFQKKQFILNAADTKKRAKNNKEIARITTELEQTRQANLDLDTLLTDIDNLKNKLYQLERSKELEESVEKSRYIKKGWIDVIQNSLDPTFQFLINIYVVLKDICLTISNYVAKAISFTSFSIGKAISAISLFHFIRDEKTPQRKIRIAHGLLSFAAAIANTTLTIVNTNPYISAAINFTTILFGLGKESYCAHSTFMTIEKSKQQLNNLIAEKDTLANKSLSSFEARRFNRLEIIIKYQTQLLQQQIDQDRFDSIRTVAFSAFYAFCGLTFLFTSLAAGTALFPPAALAILSKAAIAVGLTQLPVTVFDVTDAIFKYQASRWILNKMTDVKNYVSELFEPKNLPGFIWQAFKSGLTAIGNGIKDMIGSAEKSYVSVDTPSSPSTAVIISSRLHYSISPGSPHYNELPSSTLSPMPLPTRTDYLNTLSLDRPTNPKRF